MGCIALVRCVLVLRCGLAGVVWYPKASDINLVSLYSTIKMMDGPINISRICYYFIEDKPLCLIHKVNKLLIITVKHKYNMFRY